MFNTKFAEAEHAYTPTDELMDEKPENLPKAVFAGGCFWCTESEFRTLPGVKHTIVGYTGGSAEDAYYEDVTTGKTGHAEAIEVYFDPKETTYEELLRFFLTKAHDPTQLNRQGVDVGPQYRSAIFYIDEKQKKLAEKVIADITAEKIYDKPIVTTLESAGTFYIAEEYHQQYYEKYEKEKGFPHIRVLYKLQKKKWMYLDYLQAQH